ncbi:hypothetical protein GKR50_15770 [Providencia rustigianii]|uniref:hypothetical protein n=1 Tax=Providencia rustigianii TaxID=158850 RepID=UPI000F702FB3|nr:hypothetical protein [Providencia rustigianii]MTC61448.1 hypothetical protein [Providencia rustigianii]VEH56770.1 Uncharacterised protein [Providencia rustigianii]
MNEKLIEQIVLRVLQQMKRRVLVLLSPSQGYQQAVYQRLVQLPAVSFSFYATKEMLTKSNIEQWQELGQLLDLTSFNAEKITEYHCVFLPFIQTKTLNEVVHGLSVSEESQFVLHALSQNIPIMALKYHCCPDSELNQILGLNKNEQYGNLIKENINKAISLGIQFDTFNNIENKILIKNDEISNENKIDQNRYITLREVMNDPKEYSLNKNKLTDSAMDYLKSLKK